MGVNFSATGLPTVCLESVATTLPSRLGDGFDFARLDFHILECKQILVRDGPLSKRLAIDEQLDFIGIRGDINMSSSYRPDNSSGR